MREVRGYDGVPRHAAQPHLIAEPIDLAQARADAATLLKQCKRPLGPVLELAGRVKREVGGLVVTHERSVAPLGSKSRVALMRRQYLY